MVVYSRQLRDILISKGYRETKSPERNIQNPDFYVFFFDNTKDIKDEVEAYMKRRKR